MQDQKLMVRLLEQTVETYLLLVESSGGSANVADPTLLLEAWKEVAEKACFTPTSLLDLLLQVSQHNRTNVNDRPLLFCE